MFKVVSVVGARPNFMKIAPLEREFRKNDNIQHITVHTGQHYDKGMSDVFFDQLGLSEPDEHLGVGSGGHGEMTGKIMIGFEQACLEIKPDLVIVVGDVNSTIAASLVARKLFVPVAHVEAGLRSFDETMPEEHNRRLTDHLSNLLFVSEPSGMENLKREGIDMSRAYLVGDIMLETLQMFRPTIEKRKRWEDFGMSPQGYALATLHRPSNVDDPQSFKEIIEILKVFPIPTIFPIHPRTVNRIREFGLSDELNAIPTLHLTDPEPYVDFLSLMEGAKILFSDSGSVQAEASLFNVPCLICRDNTERPIYLERGTSSLVGRDKDKIGALVEAIQSNQYRLSRVDVTDLGQDVAKKVVKTVVDYLA